MPKSSNPLLVLYGQQTCIRCGKTFTPRNPTITPQQYCSRKCVRGHSRDCFTLGIRITKAKRQEWKRFSTEAAWADEWYLGSGVYKSKTRKVRTFPWERDNPEANRPEVSR